MIALACDHGALALKTAIMKHLDELGLAYRDYGTYTADSCDYPDIAHDVCSAVEKEDGTGILLCGTGIGMSMAANRHQGVRAAVCTTELHARLARRHNNANVLCLGARMTGAEPARAIVDAFLDTGFEGGRHQRRIDKISC